MDQEEEWTIFDLIFCSGDVLDNSNGLEFIIGSYEALGQDGDRFNGAINTPFNPTVPDSIADALFFMSDHLPVMIDLKTDYTAGVEKNNFENLSFYYNSVSRNFEFQNLPSGHKLFQLYDLSGKIVFETSINESETTYINGYINRGFYTWVLHNDDHYTSGKITISY